MFNEEKLKFGSKEHIDLSDRIPGWGSDLYDRVGVPREQDPQHPTGVHWDFIEPMIPKIKIHCSVERPALTPVFGTTCPPRLLSGKIKDIAYKFGENIPLRWMLLLFSDRVDVLEHRIEELFLGQPDMEGRHPKAVQQLALVSAAGIAGFFAFRALKPKVETMLRKQGIVKPSRKNARGPRPVVRRTRKVTHVDYAH